MNLLNLSSIKINRTKGLPIPSSSRPYQVDFSTLDAGKRVKGSKRCAKWVFGFCNNDALAAGKIGVECRGNEHEVIVTCSMSSGRKVILIDGMDVLDVKDRSEKIEFKDWFEGKPIEILAFLTDDARPKGAREFDLYLSGVSFFSLPRVFELGSDFAPKYTVRRRTQGDPLKLKGGVGGPRRTTLEE